MLKHLVLTAAAASFLAAGALGASMSSAAADDMVKNYPLWCILTPWCAMQPAPAPAPMAMHHYHHHHHHHHYHKKMMAPKK